MSGDEVKVTMLAYGSVDELHAEALRQNEAFDRQRAGQLKMNEAFGLVMKQADDGSLIPPPPRVLDVLAQTAAKRATPRAAHGARGLKRHAKRRRQRRRLHRLAATTMKSHAEFEAGTSSNPMWKGDA